MQSQLVPRLVGKPTLRTAVIACVPMTSLVNLVLLCTAGPARKRSLGRPLAGLFCDDSGQGEFQAVLRAPPETLAKPTGKGIGQLVLPTKQFHVIDGVLSAVGVVGVSANPPLGIEVDSCLDLAEVHVTLS